MALSSMAREPRDVFGAEAHEFQLSPPISPEAAAEFEARHRIVLPSDYRWFITAVGNGGAGPFYGVFPLGYADAVSESLEPWQERNGFVGSLATPFPFSEPWNDLPELPSEGLLSLDPDAYEAGMADFDSRYFFAIDGAIPLCHLGCALRIWLVVTGPEARHLWQDNRASDEGLEPLTSARGSRLTFLEWYEEWLAETEAAPVATS